MKRYAVICTICAFFVLSLSACKLPQKQVGAVGSSSTYSSGSGYVQSSTSGSTISSADSSSSSQSGPSSSIASSQKTATIRTALSLTDAASSDDPVSSAPSSSSPDNSALRAQAIADESARHKTALDSISTKYDAQISTLQTGINGFKTEGSRNTTDEIQAGQDALNQESIQLEALKHYYTSRGTDPNTMQDYVSACNIMQFNSDKYYNETKPELQKLGTDYKQEQSDISQLSTLQDERQTAINTENSNYSARIDQIYTIYPIS